MNLAGTVMVLISSIWQALGSYLMLLGGPALPDFIADLDYEVIAFLYVLGGLWLAGHDMSA